MSAPARDDARTFMDAHVRYYVDGCAVIPTETLRAVLERYFDRSSEAVERDTARIDAIQKKRATIYRSEVGHWVFVDETNRDRLGILGKDVREAIDKAMKRSTETEDGEGFDDSPTREER